MQDVRKRDIPISGDRYDMTLLKIGYKDIESVNPKIVIVCGIDNGMCVGKRVSHQFDFGTKYAAMEWRDFMAAIDVYPEYHYDDRDEYLQPFVDALRKVRFSAVVYTRWLAIEDGKWEEVDDEYEGNITVFYELSVFDEPEDDAIKIYTRATSKFNRAV